MEALEQAREERLTRIIRQLETLRRHIQRCDENTQKDVIARLRQQCKQLEKAAAKLDPNRPKAINREHNWPPVPKKEIKRASAPRTKQELLLEQIHREHPNAHIEFIVEPSQPKSVWTTGQAGGPGTGKRR